MNRSSVYKALVLRSRPFGESNREAWFLTAEAGLMRAAVFGGPKSRMRSYASPFHSGMAWMYHDPVKDSRKLTDFDVKEWRPGIRELYDRVMAADAAAETIIASHGGGGNWEKGFSLAASMLDALEFADIVMCNRLLIHFLWKWADFIGLRPEFDHCSHCGEPVPSGSMLWHIPGEGGLACASCLDAAQKLKYWEAGPGCRHWLETVFPLSPGVISRYTLDKKSFHESKSLVTAILAEALGKKLASWEW